ncbi:hypothetical protein OK468_10270 [Streptococcus pneumoniae]|uniref:hypothetical protein n=1 Tax=Streptococcus pneumoniae TaxID=1313 RepID=UPI0029D8D8ED|nr:hypothetical protein [Streptococcus pneumoniae]MDG7598408.1 hypothetical protein [Streptococcus pneumoniae]MDG7703101.1 hypothetical protein [Streptococcus pneumoniae]MDG7844594.1 hypothetical protein [Streptococcus pneumoniae]MDG7848518.1 hypothetical protein [Streptococcus pneumoniae]
MSDNLKAYLCLLGFVILAGIAIFIFPQGHFFSNSILVLGYIPLLISIYYFTKIKLIGVYEFLKDIMDKIKGI